MKKAIIISSAVFVFLIVLVAVAPMFIGADAYKNWAEKKLSGAVAARVSVGDFKLRFLPTPGYTITNLQFVSAVDPFRGLPIFSAEKVEGDISIVGLVQGKIKTSVEVYNAVIDYRLENEVSNIGKALGFAGAFGDESSSSVPLPSAAPLNGSSAAPQEIPFKAIPVPSVAPDAPADLQPEAASDSGTKMQQNPAQQKVPAAPPPASAPQAAPSQPAGATQPPVQTTTPQAAPVEIPVNQEAPPDTPTSKFEFSLIKNAYGFAPTLGEEYELVFESVKFNSATLNIYKNGEEKGALISNASALVDNIEIAGAATDSESKIVSLNLKALGSFSGAAERNVSVAVKLVYDSLRKEIIIKGGNGQFSGVPFTFDLIFNSGFSPHSFDLHLATTSLTPASVLAAKPELRNVLSRLGWQGLLALDVSAKGTRDAYELVLWSDATQSSISAEKYFSKTLGLPMKFSASAYVQPTSISIKDGTLLLGESNVKIQGEKNSGELPSWTISMQAEKINDGILRTHFPFLSNIDAAEELSGEASIASTAEGRAVSGKFTAKKIGFAGVTLENADGAFTKKGNEVSLTPLKGAYGTGTFSGSAKVIAGDVYQYSLQGVVENLPADSIAALSGFMKGNGSLVVNAETNGQDSSALAQNLSGQGTFVISQGSFSGMKIASEVFNEETWKTLEGTAGVMFDAAKKQAISQAEDSFSNMNVAYEFSSGSLKISSGTWSAPKYSIEDVSATISSQQKDSFDIRADATIIVPKNMAGLLTTDKVAKEKFLDKQERLVLPFKIAGNKSSVACTLDSVKLDELQKSRVPKTVPAKEPASAKPAPATSGKTPAAKEPSKTAPASDVKDESKQNPTTTPPEATKPAAKKQPAVKEVPASDTDSLTRIIIGQ